MLVFVVSGLLRVGGVVVFVGVMVGCWSPGRFVDVVGLLGWLVVWFGEMVVVVRGWWFLFDSHRSCDWLYSLGKLKICIYVHVYICCLLIIW